MPKIPNIFEEELRSHKPVPLDVEFLARLTASAEGTQTEPAEEDREFERLLKTVKPRAIPAALKDTLLASISDTPFSVDGKIVLFHKSAKAASTARRVFPRSNIAAAAAVALLGSIAALMVPQPDAGEDAVVTEIPVRTENALNASFTPDSIGRDLSETRDEGVIWRGKNQPHRVLRLTYIDKVTMKNEKGESYEVKRPRHEYVIIPEKID